MCPKLLSIQLALSGRARCHWCQLNAKTSLVQAFRYCLVPIRKLGMLAVDFTVLVNNFGTCQSPSNTDYDRMSVGNTREKITGNEIHHEPKYS